MVERGRAAHQAVVAARWILCARAGEVRVGEWVMSESGEALASAEES